MILSERLEGFLASLETDLPPELAELEQSCRNQGLPVIRSQTRRLLQVLLAIKKPASILEIGTCVGFSSLLMISCCPPGTQLTTIEQDPERIARARENFRQAGREGQITLLEGDAASVLAGLKTPFDMIFLDAAKGQYIHWLPELIRLMGPGSILVSDNVLQEGSLLESRFLVERRERTIYHRMREFLFAVTHEDRLETIILPTGDGVSVSVMKDPD